MSKRHKMTRQHSKHVFTQGARNVHPKNNMTAPMRGGIRL